MAYAIDVYRDAAKVERSLVEVFCYIAFFPTILSGPILRAGNFLPQLKKEHVIGTDFTRAFYLLTRGLIKKIIISSYLSEHIVRSTFGAPEGFTSAAVLVGILSYTAQIYCDFSGYSDLAQGVALLMGFDIPDNFNAPYVSLSLRDFWRRWHITFSLWLRDYLYISLGGNRKGRPRKYVNLVTTMHLLDNPHFELMRHDVTFPLYVEVDEIYNLACPASPIHYQHDPVQTTKTSVHGAINMASSSIRPAGVRRWP